MAEFRPESPGGSSITRDLVPLIKSSMMKEHLRIPCFREEPFTIIINPMRYRVDVLFIFTAIALPLLAQMGGAHVRRRRQGAAGEQRQPGEHIK